MRDRSEDDRARVAQGIRDGVRTDCFRAGFQAQAPASIDVAERERGGYLALERVQLDAELPATCGQAVTLGRADAGEKSDPIAEARGRGRGVRGRAADAPLRIALELISRGVTDRDQIEHQTLNRTCNTSPSLTG